MKIILCFIPILTAWTVEYWQQPKPDAKVPEDVQARFKAQDFDKKYDFSFHLQPSYLRADFTGDGKPDTAILVKDKKTGKIGIALCNSGSVAVFILGAGKDFGNGGDDFDWMDHWSVTPKAKLRPGIAPLIKGDALFVEKTESASALIYWTGAKYIWRQQGD